jgi:hypothetical protein
MDRAAGNGAAGGQTVTAARTSTDRATLERVRAALLCQLGGTVPAAPAPRLGPAGYMDRRAVTPSSFAGTSQGRS